MQQYNTQGSVALIGSASAASLMSVAVQIANASSVNAAATRWEGGMYGRSSAETAIVRTVVEERLSPDAVHTMARSRRAVASTRCLNQK